MTIGRRQVLGGVLGLSAFAEGCVGPRPWAGPEAASAEDVDRLLADLDRVVAGLESLEPDISRFGIKVSEARKAENALGKTACLRLMTSVCFLGSYRDVPEAMWQQPRIEDRLKKTLPQLRDTLGAARNHIARITETDGARIDERLRDDPNLTMRIMERVDEYAKQLHVPLEQRMYLRTATAQLSGRFRFEGTKDYTAKLAAKYDRALGSRMSELGMQGAADADTGGGEQKPQPPPPLRVQFRSRSAPTDIHRVTCELNPKVTLDGADRQVLLDWEEFQCPTTAPVSGDAKPIHATVHAEPGEDNQNIVTVTLFPPTDSTDTSTLTEMVTSIARELRSRLTAEAQSFAGQTCVTSADCGPLRCIAEHCVDPSAKPTVTAGPRVDARLGSLGESCRTGDDCESPLTCTQSTCASGESSSARLMKTTRKIAKWGAILLIPPICAIGVLVLLTCLFMVIVAGCLNASGD